MAAVDLKPGKVIWQTPMVPKGYTGGALWSSTPAIDPTRGVVYITTGNNYTTPKEVAECQESGKRDCLPIDDHIDSFLALYLKTGAIKWATRVVPFDTWNGNCFVNEPGLGTCREPRGGDLDFGQGPPATGYWQGPRLPCRRTEERHVLGNRSRLWQSGVGHARRSGRSERRNGMGLGYHMPPVAIIPEGCIDQSWAPTELSEGAMGKA